MRLTGALETAPKVKLDAKLTLSPSVQLAPGRLESAMICLYLPEGIQHPTIDEVVSSVLCSALGWNWRDSGQAPDRWASEGRDGNHVSGR
ncbi:hypothetical protein NDU88_000475 [Pleurodeles waltl]|uniref:Uncharacterized protein n=1 Tax=Pleurodeles waltl TaxID=8319 RepID=A0AAV7NAH2_PLEWA|nr:hypothetical protein NDU88_000475 [Pleurodeles waltl]